MLGIRIDAYHQLLSIVVAALAVSHYNETQTGWMIKKFVHTARHYRTAKIKLANQSCPPPTTTRRPPRGDRRNRQKTCHATDFPA